MIATAAWGSSFMAVATATAYCSTNHRDVASQRGCAARTGHGAAFSVDGEQSWLAGKRQQGKQDGRHQPREKRLDPPSRAVTSRDKPIRKNTKGTISIRQIGCVLGRSDCEPCQIR